MELSNPFDEIYESIEKILVEGMGSDFRVIEAPISDAEGFDSPTIIFDIPELEPTPMSGKGGIDFNMTFFVTLIYPSSDLRFAQRQARAGISKVALLFKHRRVYSMQNEYPEFLGAQSDRLVDDSRGYESWTAEFSMSINVSGRYWSLDGSYPANELVEGDCEGVVIAK